MMSFLIWIETVLLLGLISAFALAWAMRWAPSRWRLVAMIAAAVMPSVLVLGPLSIVALRLQARFSGIPVTGVLLAQVSTLIAGLWLLRQARHRSPWPRLRLGLGTVAAVVLLLTTISQARQAALVRVQASAGEPLALVLSVSPGPLPAESNAAVPYRRVFAELESRGAALDELFADDGQPWPDEDPRWNDATRHLDDWATVLADLHEGGRRPGCWFERDYSGGLVFTLMPELGGMMSASRLLRWAIRARVKAGEHQLAWNNLRALSRLAHHLGQESFMIGQLVAASLDWHLFECMEIVLGHAEMHAVDHDLIDPARSWQRQASRAVIVERAFAEQALTQFVSNARDVRDAGSMIDLYPLAFDVGGHNWEWSLIFSPLFDGVYGALLFENDIYKIRRDYGAVRQASQKSWSAFTQLHTADDQLLRPTILGALLLPAFASYGRSIAIAEARRSLLRLALAARSYRRQHGVWPQTGATLPGFTWPNDPFADTSPHALMQSEERDGALVLWSIGPDAIDDHGLVPYDRHTTAGDLVLRVVP